MNANCIEGFKCPECGHTESFRIGMIGNFHYRDGLISTSTSAQFKPNTYCQCNQCDHAATVAEFTVKPTTNAETFQVIADGLNALDHCYFGQRNPNWSKTHARDELVRIVAITENAMNAQEGSVE